MTWHELISTEMDRHNDAWSDEIGRVGDIDAEPDEPVTLWTTSRVYFPYTDRGRWQVASLPTKPDGKTHAVVWGLLITREPTK
jgi:hypothetical protein